MAEARRAAFRHHTKTMNDRTKDEPMAATMNTLRSDRARGAPSRPRSGQDRPAPKDARTAYRDGNPNHGTPRARDGAGKLRLLVANAPLSYRQAIAAAITALRPDVEVLLGEPEALDTEVERFSPDVVVCSHVTPLVESRVLAWVDLYPGGDRRATISMDGLRVETGGVELDDLLSIIDQRVRLAKTRG
jgi:hypothetical protein